MRERVAGRSRKIRVLSIGNRDFLPIRIARSVQSLTHLHRRSGCTRSFRLAVTAEADISTAEAGLDHKNRLFSIRLVPFDFYPEKRECNDIKIFSKSLKSRSTIGAVNF